jgi:hypothetical protein
MKTLITHSYFLRFDPKQWGLQQPYAPIGAMYAASVLRSIDCNVSFHDTMFNQKADEIIASLKKHKPDWFIIYDDGFNYLTKMFVNIVQFLLSCVTLCRVLSSYVKSSRVFVKFWKNKKRTSCV